MTQIKKIKVGVLFGGRSGEHEVSLVSAQSVMDHLDKEKYEVVPIGITKAGKWIAGADSMRLLRDGNAPNESNMSLLAEPQSTALAEHGALTDGIDVFFPVLHGTYGEDGTVQGFLELTSIPYVGCGVLASALCMDKVLQKKALAGEHIKQTPYDWFWTAEWEQNKEELLGRIENVLTYPLFVKPANLGSSVGIAKAKNREDLARAIDDAAQYDRKVIVEQAVPKPREIEVSVIGNQHPFASVPGEIIPSNEFYDYNAKYIDGKSIDRVADDLTKVQIKAVQEIAVHTYKTLSCEGMARVDFLLSLDGEFYLNEVNTIPGFTGISMFPKLWEASGKPFVVLLDELIQLAIERNNEKNKLRTSFKPDTHWYK